MRRFRAARMATFQRLFQVDEYTRILDVGGTPGNWSLLAARPQVTILNLPRAIERDRDLATWIFADGCRLPFRDKSFDIVFSNSVIEHLGNSLRHQQYASEIDRVGIRYFVQTPNRWFPVEPHLLTPLIHFLPPRWQKPLIQKFTIWQWVAQPRPDQRAFYLEHYLRDIQLLDSRAMRRLFPGAGLIRERFLGFTKSLIVVRLDKR
jgi:SAM-dependent methyltransferase